MLRHAARLLTRAPRSHTRARRFTTTATAAPTAAPTLVKIALEPLTAEAFEPFGEICGTMAGGEPSLYATH